MHLIPLPAWPCSVILGTSKPGMDKTPSAVRRTEGGMVKNPDTYRGRADSAQGDAKLAPRSPSLVS